MEKNNCNQCSLLKEQLQRVSESFERAKEEIVLLEVQNKTHMQQLSNEQRRHDKLMQRLRMNFGEEQKNTALLHEEALKIEKFRIEQCRRELETLQEQSAKEREDHEQSMTLLRQEHQRAVQQQDRILRAHFAAERLQWKEERERLQKALDEAKRMTPESLVTQKHTAPPPPFSSSPPQPPRDVPVGVSLFEEMMQAAQRDANNARLSKQLLHSQQTEQTPLPEDIPQELQQHFFLCLQSAKLLVLSDKDRPRGTNHRRRQPSQQQSRNRSSAWQEQVCAIDGRTLYFMAINQKIPFHCWVPWMCQSIRRMVH